MSDKAMTTFIRVAYEDSNYATAALDAARKHFPSHLIRSADLSYTKDNAVYLMCGSSFESDTVVEQYLRDCVGALPKEINR